MKLKNLTTSAIISLSIVLIGALYLEVLWLDWLIQSILNRDVSRWLLAVILMGVGFFTPHKLAGLPIFLMFLATCYVWVV